MFKPVIHSLAVIVLASTSLLANHPVFVEGNCLVPPAGNPGAVAPGTCGDYDGDGRIGVAEDNDGDRVFGTITGALGSLPTGANQNGKVIIVTSGVFAEVVNITAANGNVTLEAAPGVNADIDAVLQGDPNSGARQNSPGIIVDSPNNRYVIIRNLQIRNWTSGIQVNGRSRVAIESCRIENNRDYGVEVTGSARVKIDQSQILGSGFRSGAAPVNNTPNPGKGIEFDDSSSGAVFRTEVSGSFSTGISRKTRTGQVTTRDVYLFDNQDDDDFGPRR